MLQPLHPGVNGRVLKCVCFHGAFKRDKQLLLLIYVTCPIEVIFDAFITSENNIIIVLSNSVSQKLNIYNDY